MAANAPAVVAPALGALFVFPNTGGPQPARARQPRAPNPPSGVVAAGSTGARGRGRAKRDRVRDGRFPDGASDLMSEHLGSGGAVACTSEERIAIIGLIGLVFVAGVIIIVASYFDSLTKARIGPPLS